MRFFGEDNTLTESGGLVTRKKQELFGSSTPQEGRSHATAQRELSLLQTEPLLRNEAAYHKTASL
jgi:hypothetical protein